MSPNYQREFSGIRLTDRQQELSNIYLLDYKQRFSNKRSQIASNQNDACPRHLAMLVTAC
jgi:hypothetical protein